MKNHIKKGIAILVILASLSAGYFLTTYIIKIRTTAAMAWNQTQVISKFLVDTFPEQVQAFESNMPK